MAGLVFSIVMTAIGIFLILLGGIHMQLGKLEKRICRLCAEHNDWAKGKGIKACDCYGCLYDKLD